jgi:FKBP-type peptidyl-prolyl cis-trans isomerase SlyD
MNIAEDTVVTLHYTLKNEGGEVLESSSVSGEPLSYLHGTGSIIPGLETALEGRLVGDKFQVSIPPAQAYGERVESLVQRIPRDQFPNSERLTTGMQFQINGPQGPLILTVQEVSETDVVVDGNHELAGETLTFDVEVTEVRAATEDEIEHGHAHGPGGHHHD